MRLLKFISSGEIISEQKRSKKNSVGLLYLCQYEQKFKAWNQTVGYLNARIGDKSDTLQKEHDPFLPLPNDDIYESILSILSRVSSDRTVVNQYGNWLIDLCVDNQLYIFNGRTLGDLATSDVALHMYRAIPNILD